MDELMAASDLFVGKPGGLTTSEVLAKGLPMVVINPIPGQEERNSDHLLEEGIAIRCNNLPALAYKIDRLIDEPGKLHLMRACAGPRQAPGGVHDPGSTRHLAYETGSRTCRDAEREEENKPKACLLRRRSTLFLSLPPRLGILKSPVVVLKTRNKEEEIGDGHDRGSRRRLLGPAAVAEGVCPGDESGGRHSLVSQGGDLPG